MEAPPPLPLGSYDPALNAQLGQAQRGFGDLQQDVATANARDTADYGLARENLLRQTGMSQQDLDLQQRYGGEDLQTNFDRGSFDLSRGLERGEFDLNRGLSRTNEGLDRSLSRGNEDIGLQRRYGSEDYSRNVGLLQRSYEQLSNRQRQGRNAAGVLSGGAALQAAQKRAANQAIDRQPLDTGFQRLNEGLDISGRRLGEDVGTQRRYANEDFDSGLGRLRQDAATGRDYLTADYARGASRLGEGYATNTARLADQSQLGQGNLALSYQRGMADRGQQLTRAGRENAQFGLDVNTQKAFQAAQAGYFDDDWWRR